MWLILCVALLISPVQVDAMARQVELADQVEQVELFDTDKQKVVETFPNSSIFQEQAEKILNSVSGRVLELNPSLEQAMIVKIPLAPPKPLVHKPSRLDVQIATMFVVMPKSGKRAPWLILHTKEHETVVVEFAGKIELLREQLRLPK
jgi:hypothetical protein